MTGTGFYNGNLPIGGVELWTFTICAGELIDVRADEITQTNTFDPWVRVYDPTGALIGSNFGATFGEVTLTTPNGGRYLVLISNNPYYNDAGSGTYKLTVNGLSDGFKICSPIVSGSQCERRWRRRSTGNECRTIHHDKYRNPCDVLDPHSNQLV